MHSRGAWESGLDDVTGDVGVSAVPDPYRHRPAEPERARLPVPDDPVSVRTFGSRTKVRHCPSTRIPLPSNAVAAACPSTSGRSAFRHPPRRALPDSSGTAGIAPRHALHFARVIAQPFHTVAPVVFPGIPDSPSMGGQPNRRSACSAAGYAVSTLASRQTLWAMLELPPSLRTSSRNACISNLGFA